MENQTNKSVQPINHFHKRTTRTRINFNPATARKTRIKNEDMPKQSLIRNLANSAPREP